MPGISVSRIPIPFNKGGFSYSSYWTTLYNAMTNKPNAAYSSAANTFVKTLVDAGIWAKLDILYVFAAHTNDGGEALLNWIDPTKHAATITGTVDFVAGEGFKGDGIDGEIDTHYNASTQKVHYSQNEASIGIFVNKLSTVGASGDFGNAASQSYIGVQTTTYNRLRGTVNSVADYANTTPAAAAESLVVITRKDANTIETYVNGVSRGDKAVASAAIYNANYKLFYYPSAIRSNAQISMAFAGGLLTDTDNATLNTAWDAFFFDVAERWDYYAKIMSDTNDLYSHESQTVIKQIGGVDYLFMLYMSNKISGLEWQTTAHALLKVFNLSTSAHIRTFVLFYPGLEAGAIIPVNDEINVPRMYFYGADTLRCFVPNTSTLYTRDITISDSDPDNWTEGDISIAQMTMKNADGDDVLADVTSANINIHLDYIFGDNYDGYHNLMPLFRNLDPAKSGANWYATLECSSERSHGLARPTLLLTSPDSGNTWTFSTPIGYTVLNRIQLVETAIIFIGTDLHTISRGASIVHFKSEDSGATWVQQDNLSIGVLSSKPCAINYLNEASELKNVMALTLTSEISGNVGRTTLGIYSTTDFTALTEVTKIITPTYCHYPSLCYYKGHLYVTYTKGIPEGSSTDRNAIGFVKIY